MKKYIYKWFMLLVFIAFVFISCDKFLDVQPKGKQLLETVTDYEEWLNTLHMPIPDDLNYLGDDVDDVGLSDPLQYTSEWVYTWQKQFTVDLDDDPYFWSDHYTNIYYLNTVLVGIDEATGTEEEKASLKAEALLGRAFEYLYLVNLYGKPYDASTADQDLAVPFVTSNDLEDDVPDRSTIQEIYNHIIEDLTNAVSGLPEDNSDNRFRGSVAAAYSMLARVYLYMGDYTNAAQNAQLALDNGPNEVLDYTVMSSRADIPHIITRSDVIFARLPIDPILQYYPTLSFLRSFDTTDLRLNFFYKSFSDYNFLTRGQARYCSGTSSVFAYPGNWGTSVPEMRLILAEAAARANDLPEACDQLDLLRQKRFPEFIIDSIRYDSDGTTPLDTAFFYEYEKFESTVQEEVLQKVLTERTFELAFCGFRWFDMRRLDAEGRMETVYRYDGEGNIVATLPAGSNKYTLQIPTRIMYFNPDWEQNEWDEE